MEFLEILKKQIIVMDGAMGTMIQNLHLSDADFGGKDFSMLVDILVFSRPKKVKDIHLAYYRSGANAVETNTFGASPLRLSEYDFKNLDISSFGSLSYNLDLKNLTYEEMSYWLNKVGSEIANRAKSEHKKEADYDGRPLFVIGSIGPSNYVLSNTKADLKKGTWTQVEDNFYYQVLGLIDGGADILSFETQQDVLEIKAAVSGAYKAMEKKQKRLPIMVHVTVDQFSKMQIFNTDILAALVTLQDIGIDIFGVNCSIGPDLMRPTLDKLSRYCKLPISVFPNAGLPVSENGKTVYKLGPDEFSEYLLSFVEENGVNVVGGCCGTTPEHIRKLSEAVKGKLPEKREVSKDIFISGPQEAVLIDSKQDLIRFAERLNVRGSKKVREAVENEDDIDFDTLEEVVNEQVKDLGVPIIDVCMDSNIVNTVKVLPQVIQNLTLDFPGAMCIDSFDVEALEKAVKSYPGRPIINSISIEEYSDGVSKIDALLPITKFHHPMYIALTTDLSGPAVTSQEKYDIAHKIVDHCSQYGVTPDQLFIDVNAFPIGSESVEGLNFALESLNSIPMIKTIHPDLKTTIGVGNLTNGLAKKPYMRMLLTSVFLDEACKKGLDAAIVNPNHYVPVDSLDKNDYQLGLKVIFGRDMDAFARLEDIADEKKGKKVVRRKNYDDLPLTTAICEKIKDGYKERTKGKIKIDNWEYEYSDQIVVQAREVIENMPPLELINDHLMVAMKDLGDRFGRGDVSLPHLLKSADVMKQVMGFLEAYIKRNTTSDNPAEISYKGTIVLGTVYQDIHSIGKDLAKTLLENYGYRVIDLGVQVPLEKFITTARKEEADAIGLSALLVQTSNHMITLSKMLQKENLNIPLLIGGAPVNKRHAGYVSMHGQEDISMLKPDVFYCPTAMDGVNVMNIFNSTERDNYIAENSEKLKAQYLQAKKNSERKENLLETLPRRQIKFDDYSLPENINYGVSVINIPLVDLPINKKSLYGLNWRLGGKHTWERKGLDEEKIEQLREKWINDSHENGWLKPQGMMGLFPCNSDGDEVIVYNPEDLSEELARFDFNVVIGNGHKDIFSAAQFFKTLNQGKRDVIGLQISTGGISAQYVIENFKKEGDNESALLLQGLSDRVAEDMAELIHSRLRECVNIDQNDGARYSPGYPGMININLNKTIYDLLNANQLGIGLTEANEFIPTGTTSAVVCFHPDASYG